MFKVMSDRYHKGFHMTFENGWTVSVQFGKNNYASNKQHTDESPDAEIAAWDKDGNWYHFKNGDDVFGYEKTDDVAEFIAMIAAKD